MRNITRVWLPGSLMLWGAIGLVLGVILNVTILVHFAAMVTVLAVAVFTVESVRLGFF